MYRISRDNKIAANKLSAYTVYHKSGKNTLYLLKPTITDIHTIIVTDHPGKNVIAKADGEWIAKIFNVTFSIYDKKLGKWIDGTIKKDSIARRDTYYVQWNSTYLSTKFKLFSNMMLVYNSQPKELLAEFGYRDWLTDYGKFTLKVYSNHVSDIIYFFLFANELLKNDF